MAFKTGYWRASLRRLIYKRTFYLTLFAVLLGVVFLGSFLIFHFEKNVNPTINTYWDAVWLLVITMATVGYGDKYPITAGGKVSDIIAMVMGIALLTTIITAQASLRIEKAGRRSRGLEKKTTLRDHFLVCGWNTRGEYVVARLISSERSSRVPIVVLCQAETKPVDNDLVFFFKGSPASERDLQRANVSEARAVVLLADETGGGSSGDVDARTVLAALTVKSLNPEARITAEVLEPENVGHLRRAGVGEILDYNLIAGNLIGQSALRYGLIELVTTLSTKDASARFYGIPVSDEMVGRDVEAVSSEMVQERGLSVVGVRKQGREMTFGRGVVLEGGDVLMVIGEERPPDAIN